MEISYLLSKPHRLKVHRLHVNRRVNAQRQTPKHIVMRTHRRALYLNRPLGRATFRLKQGYYRIMTHSDTLGDRHRTVDLKENYDLAIEYTDADQSTEGPLSILPQWDLSSEQD